MISNQTTNDQFASPMLPSRTSSFKNNEQNSTSTSSLPKPNIPPPSIPNPRPPSIGFNVSPSDTTNNNNNNNNNMNQENVLPYPVNVVWPLFPILTNLESNSTSNLNPSSSSFSSASSSMAGSISTNNSDATSPHSPDSNTGKSSNGVQKPPKPLVPRKPGNIIAQHINKFENGVTGQKLDDLVDQVVNLEDAQNKSSQEITFL
jgi:hypothetical protein